ncbi:MAG: glycine cleavage system protein GcvH [Luminiphilus sp.]|jgi:glycine cleavage system H protein|nr:glycine cleavage system protein GcvH [Luminiphilus sp.]MDG1460866.1 glycine cleavage system protein GcvH [Luminiphilus sp.]
MSNNPSELRYAKSHEWARVEEDGTVTVGISDHAQESLGDVVYVELPSIGDQLAGGDQAGLVESVKAASDIYSPVTGEVIALNENLEDEPELINTDPYNDGWFFRVKVEELSELEGMLAADDYADACTSDD